ncbi:MAG: hypothetical protein ABIS06_17865 [Vicinamibacterales bacterium]
MAVDAPASGRILRYEWSPDGKSISPSIWLRLREMQPQQGADEIPDVVLEGVALAPGEQAAAPDARNGTL